MPPSKTRKRLNKPQWGEAEKQLVLRIRRNNPTYGKDKIAVILLWPGNDDPNIRMPSFMPTPKHLQPAISLKN